MSVPDVVIRVPWWAVWLFVALCVAWQIAMTVQSTALKELYRLYVEARYGKEPRE